MIAIVHLTVGKDGSRCRLQKRLADTRDQNYPVAPPMAPKIDNLDVLTVRLIMTQKPGQKSCTKAELAKWQGRLWPSWCDIPEFAKQLA
jgi:hypothetical protein